ncbi:hypothetical protein ACVXHA_12585 [Escherichia coli]
MTTLEAGGITGEYLMLTYQRRQTVCSGVVTASD